MKTKEKIISYFFSKINIDFFSSLVKRHGWLFGAPYKFFSQKLIDYDFPRHLFIETTALCNLQCKMCPRNDSPAKPGTMNFELFKKIVDESARHGERAFSLHLFGEPLLDRQIIEKIQYIKKANQQNSILLTTNGTLMTENIAKELVENKVDKIAVSIHSPNPETYSIITGFEGLEKTEDNIKRLVAIKKEAGANLPKIFLRMVRTNDNAEEVEIFRKKWKELPVLVEIREGHNYGGGIINNPQKNTPKKRYPCYHLWLSPGIKWDGEMTICCSDPKRQAVVGDVKKASIEELWKGEKIKKYREFHLRGEYHKISACRNCDVWDIYPDIFFSQQKNKKNEIDNPSQKNNGTA